MFISFGFSLSALLERLDSHYSSDHPDSSDVQQGISMFEAAMGSFDVEEPTSSIPSDDNENVLSNVEKKIRQLENVARLMELQR